MLILASVFVMVISWIQKISFIFQIDGLCDTFSSIYDYNRIKDILTSIMYILNISEAYFSKFSCIFCTKISH